MKQQQLVDRLVRLERQMAADKGPFTLFAFLLREDSDHWDVVAAAPWITADKAESLRFIAEQLQSRLDLHELRTLSGVVLIDEDNPYLEAVIQTKAAQEGVIEVRDEEFFGLPIQRGYIITAKRPSIAPAVETP